MNSKKNKKLCRGGGSNHSTPWAHRIQDSAVGDDTVTKHKH